MFLLLKNLSSLAENRAYWDNVLTNFANSKADLNLNFYNAPSGFLFYRRKLELDMQRHDSTWWHLSCFYLFVEPVFVGFFWNKKQQTTKEYLFQYIQWIHSGFILGQLFLYFHQRLFFFCSITFPTFLKNNCEFSSWFASLTVKLCSQ